MRRLEIWVVGEDCLGSLAGDVENLTVGAEVGYAQVECDAALHGALDVARTAQLHVGFGDSEPVGGLGHDFKALACFFGDVGFRHQDAVRLVGSASHASAQLVQHELSIGRQAYIVYPLIQENEKLELKALEEGFEYIRNTFRSYKVSFVHGKMKPAEKDAEMQKFVSGETQILVATTVIEVGVNVPNASVMVILDAQRFGLSQLHQLRGRVGRGAEQSYCILVTTYKLSDITRKRIDIMCDTNDGFRIAEADLKLRGPGDLEGTQQSGIAFDLKIADIARDGQLVALARQEAQKIIDADPTCSSNEYALLWRRLRELRDTNINWAAIS